MLASATVKAVVSGDTLVLLGKSVNDLPPSEIVITLASINAPRISKASQGPAEEKFAWESKEFLRTLLIGKSVTFTVLYCVASKNFGDVYINSSSVNVEDISANQLGEDILVSKLIVRSGWASVKELSDERSSLEHDDLVSLQALAKSQNRGLFTTDSILLSSPVTAIDWNPTSTQQQTFFDKYHNKPVRVLIEHVRDGSSFRILSPETREVFSLYLAGVVCPRTKSTAHAALTPPAAVMVVDNGPAGGESSGDLASQISSEVSVKARHFSELRLLHRELDILILDMEKNGNMYGAILHPKGNISVELVKNGLAKVSDKTLALLDRNTISLLRAQEKDARENRLFIWSHPMSFGTEEIERQNNLENSNDSSASSSTEWIGGFCVEVLSPDTMVVCLGPSVDTPNPFLACTSTGTKPSTYRELRLTLSHIKTPRMVLSSSGTGTAQTQYTCIGGVLHNLNETDTEPLALQSKEFLLTNLLGKRVFFKVEYTRSSPSQTQTQSSQIQTPRYFGSVRFGSGSASGRGKSSSLLMVADGLATVSRQGNVGTGSQEDFDSLLIAERDALARKKGIHRPTAIKEAEPKVAVLDYSVDAKKSKTVHVSSMSSLKARSLRAVVQYVISGSRLKLFIPAENCIVTFALGAVRCFTASSTSSTHAKTGVEEDLEAMKTFFGEQARLLTRILINQRPVEIVIDDIDKFGTALGSLQFFIEGPSATLVKQSLAQTLLQAGLAKLDRRHESNGDLLSSQHVGRDNSRGLWGCAAIANEESAATAATPSSSSSSSLEEPGSKSVSVFASALESPPIDITAPALVPAAHVAAKDPTFRFASGVVADVHAADKFYFSWSSVSTPAVAVTFAVSREITRAEPAYACKEGELVLALDGKDWKRGRVIRLPVGVRNRGRGGGGKNKAEEKSAADPEPVGGFGALLLLVDEGTWLGDVSPSSIRPLSDAAVTATVVPPARFDAYYLPLACPPSRKIDFGNGPVINSSLELLRDLIADAKDRNCALEIGVYPFDLSPNQRNRNAQPGGGAGAGAAGLSKFNYASKGSSNRSQPQRGDGAAAGANTAACAMPAMVFISRDDLNASSVVDGPLLWEAEEKEKEASVVTPDLGLDGDEDLPVVRAAAAVAPVNEVAARVSFDEILIRLGLATVAWNFTKQMKNKVLLHRVEEAKYLAKADHLNIYRYGDAPVEGDGEEDFN